MIVNKNTNPERDLYYLGALVIEIIDSANKVEFDYLELYKLLNKDRKVSISLYSLVLDWLFLLGTIKNSHKGIILKCF